MPLRHLLLAATAATVLSSAVPGLALAAPSVVDPNFNQTATTSPYFYGVTAWGATTDTTSPYYTGNPSFAGNVGFDTNNQWDNGTPGNGQAKVGFIANDGSISQTISGFTVGDSYVITVLANGRVVVPQATPTLTITVGSPVVFLASAQSALSPGSTVYSAAVAPVAAVGDTTTPFGTITSAAFTATSSSELITLANTGPSQSSLLLSGFALQDVTGLPVPEPVSLALLGTGLAGLVAARRRR